MTKKKDPGALAGAHGAGGNQVRGELLPDTTDRRTGTASPEPPAANLAVFRWPMEGMGAIAIGDVQLCAWRREPRITRLGVIGFADVALPRRGVCCCRLRCRRGRVWVEWAGSGVGIQWREVNPRYAWAIVELIITVDPEARADDGSIPFIPASSWGAP
jgi:hypothetical protein